MQGQSLSERKFEGFHGYTAGDGQPGLGGGGTLNGTNSGATQEDWENIFGPGARDIKFDQQAYKRDGRLHLPSVLDGVNHYLTDRIDGLITDATNSPFTTIILPYQYLPNPDAKFTWNRYSFDEGLASRVPYESAARTMAQTRRSYEGYTVRQGLAITMEHNFMMSPQGRENFFNKWWQVVGSIQKTNDLDVHIALLNAPSFAAEIKNKYYTKTKTNHQILREHVDMFGFMQKNVNALDILIEEAKITLQMWGNPQPPTFMLCNPKLTMQLTMTPERTNFITQGYDGIRRLKQGPMIDQYRGLSIIHSRQYSLETGAPPRDLLRRRVRTAEYYRIEWQECFRGHGDQVFVELYDESRDTFFKVSWNELKQHALLDDVDGLDDFEIALDFHDAVLRGGAFFGNKFNIKKGTWDIVKTNGLCKVGPGQYKRFPLLCECATGLTYATANDIWECVTLPEAQLESKTIKAIRELYGEDYVTRFTEQKKTNNFAWVGKENLVDKRFNSLNAQWEEVHTDKDADKSNTDSKDKKTWDDFMQTVQDCFTVKTFLSRKIPVKIQKALQGFDADGQESFYYDTLDYMLVLIATAHCILENCDNVSECKEGFEKIKRMVSLDENLSPGEKVEEYGRDKDVNLMGDKVKTLRVKLISTRTGAESSAVEDMAIKFGVPGGIGSINRLPENNGMDLVIVRPCIEHNMLACVLGRGGAEDLGCTFWGQTELSCYDDSMHGIWGMSYKYHERAIVTNERNLIRLYDVAYDGYNGGKDNTFMNWKEPEEFSEEMLSFDKPYSGPSMFVMAIPHEGKTWPSPIVFADPDNNVAPMPVDAENVENIVDDKMHVFKSGLLRPTYLRYMERLPGFKYFHVNRKSAGYASCENESTSTCMAFQGTYKVSAAGNIADFVPVDVKGSGHHGVDYVGVASVRNGKGYKITGEHLHTVRQV